MNFSSGKSGRTRGGACLSPKRPPERGNRLRAVLKGVVATKADSDLAYLKARGVPGLFDVKNELQVESERAR